MRASLARWVGEADAVRLLDQLAVAQVPLALGPARIRVEDFYVSLVGELFDKMREGYQDQNDWARLGNALAQFAAPDRAEDIARRGISANEALLFAGGAFYLGGFPASAYLTMKQFNVQNVSDLELGCHDLLARPRNPTSALLRRVLASLRNRDAQTIELVMREAARREQELLPEGATEWIPARLLRLLLERFRQTNLRAVLPNGNTDFWDRLVASFIDRPHSTWEFFPSQIEAIRRGLLGRAESFSLQMPTGAGKTALCETLLYWHLKSNPFDAAILLVPYRSLAAELRGSLVRRLNDMGISARCAYGGTVPTGNEAHGLDQLRALVATPEALSGLFSAAPEFLRRVSLVICDEGHLLDSGSRGVGLELLLARLSARQPARPRFVFISAIVPNIEEINAWLGGNNDSVVRSNYRPALAEFALLSSTGEGNNRSIALKLHPHEAAPLSFTIDGFLAREDFQYINEATTRRNTLNFGSVKALAVAAARKALPMGAVAIFAANKRGDQGAIGIGGEILRQTDVQLRIPAPLAFANAQRLDPAVQYVRAEYGGQWIGTRTLERGVVLHHGDIPQETREVLEGLVRREAVRFVICTATLAEGVNLPIRTLVLYSIQRRSAAGPAENLLARDIKNLVGRAGRAGAATKGLVICANEDQWPILEPVVRQVPGETVIGELRRLIESVRRVLAARNLTLTNEILEASVRMHPLIDGIDYTLIDLAAAELGEDELVRIAAGLADHTFATRQTDDATKNVLRNVFELRARKLFQIQAAGRLGWIRETGAKTRMIDIVERTLLPRRPAWDDINDPLEGGFVTVMLDWAWTQGEVLQAVRQAYRTDQGQEDTVKTSFYNCVLRWLEGGTYAEIAQRAELEVGETLGVQVTAVTFVLQSSIEQAIGLLAKLLESQNRGIAQAVLDFPDHLRFGVPTATARVLAAAGLRHRRAAVEFGQTEVLAGFIDQNRDAVFTRVREALHEHAQGWRERLGVLVYENTLEDVTPRT
jgi:helicase